jgi:outer membrane protein OmpA-like peptidoglycan-associated protein
MTTRLSPIAAPVLALLAALPAATRAKEPCAPVPIFSTFPGAKLDSCERSRFATVDIMRWKDLEKRGGGVDHLKKEGESWYSIELLPKDANGRKPGKVEIQRNFENAVLAAKGTILYVNQGGGRLFFRMVRDDGEWWGEAGCGGGDAVSCNSILNRVVRVAAMEQSVVVKADQIAAGMAEDGKVAFYGLYFDTDQSVLKPESAPSLAEMARWLKDNPSAKVFIVGHTDMVGAVPHNLALSRDRAGAVVAALVKQHGIAADRLEPQGVGPFSPVRNNAGEAGRTRNRRVEMVLR